VAKTNNKLKQKKKYSLLRSILALINVVFAIIFTFSLLASHTSAVYFSIFAISGLFYPLLLFINLVFVFLWLFIKKRYAIISLSVILLGFGNLMHNFNFSVFNNSVEEKNTTKVLSYNVKQFNTLNNFTQSVVKNDILNFVRDQKADIICFQEFQSHNKNIYEPLKKIRDTLNHKTYYYESYYNPRFNYLTGLVIFSNYKAVNKGRLKFEGSRTFGIFTDLLINADTIRVYNIHLASISLDPSDIQFVVNPELNSNEEFADKSLVIYNKLAQAFVLRQKQVDVLVEEIKNCKHKIILSGDFNDTPSSLVYDEISELLNDSFTEKGFGLGVTYAGRIPLLRIDYIFSSNGFEVLDFKTHNILRSDHFPVSAVLSRN
jgi:endonuclease/exonuclease/phosphatase family metal-dependent hydrolase